MGRYREVPGHRERQETESRPHSKVVLHFIRHEAKGSAQPGQHDREVELTEAGRKAALDKAQAENRHEIGWAAGSGRVRSAHTALIRLEGAKGKITPEMGFTEAQAAVEADLKVGNKVTALPELNFHLEGTKGFYDESMEAIKGGTGLEWILNDSDRRILELKDKDSYSLSRTAANYASLLAREMQAGENFNRVVAREPEKYQEYENTMTRWFGTHQTVTESFIMKVLEKTQGRAAAEKFIEEFRDKDGKEFGFDFEEGIDVDIINDDQGQRVIMHKTRGLPEDIELTPELLRDIINDAEELDRQIEQKEAREAESFEAIRQEVKEVMPEMVMNYTDFHEHPELGGQEYRTAAKVKEALEKMGIEIVGEHIGLGIKDGQRAEGTGVVAIIRGKEGGPTIALRADMDALPITEDEKHVPKSKTEGVMHGCGHDIHTSSLLGAAEVLKERAEQGELDGDVMLIFQPSEEKTSQKESGAIQIIKFLEENGWRDKIDAFFALHVAGQMERGKINLREGIQFPSSGEIEISLRSAGGHIMNSRDIPNLNVIASKITVSLDKIFEPYYRENKALVASARTEFGEKGYNVLAPTAESPWVVRVVSPEFKKVSSEIYDLIRTEVQRIIDEEIERMGKAAKDLTVDIKRRPGYRPVVHRDSELVGLADRAGRVIGDKYQRQTNLIMAGEDFSFYGEEFKGKQIPIVFAMVGGADAANGYPPVGHHTKKFLMDPDAMGDLAAMHVAWTEEAIKHFRNKIVHDQELVT